MRWVVLLEAAGEAERVDPDAVGKLLEELGAHPAALVAADRYSLQLSVEAAGPPEALFVALCRWAEATRKLGVDHWGVVRAEVLTTEEFERDLASYGSSTSHEPDPVGAGAEHGAGRALAQELLERAFNDPLTGLGTPATFRTRLDQLLSSDDRATHAVVCVALHDFGSVDDRLGHTVSDQVLVTLAQRLTAVVRPGDAVACLRRHQFAVLLENSSASDTAAVAERIVDVLEEPLGRDGEKVVLKARAGVALSQPGSQADEVVDNALAALPPESDDGEHRYRIFGADTAPAAPTRHLADADDRHDRLAYLLLLQQAAMAANESATLEEAAEVVVRQFCTHTGWSVGHLYLVPQDEPDRLTSTDVWHAPGDRYARFREVTQGTAFAAGEGLAGRVLATGRPAWIADLSSDRDFPKGEAALAAGLRAAFAFPVVIGREVTAVLEFLGADVASRNGTLIEVATAVGAQLGRVAERSRAQAALEASEEKFRALAESASDAIVSLDATGRVVSWNRAAETMFGYSRAEVLGRGLPTALRRYQAQAEHPLFGTEFGRVLEFTGVRRDGSEFPLEISVSSWETSEGRFRTAIVRDITERKRTELALRESERRLREAQALARLGSYHYDLRTGKATWSPEMHARHGTDPTGPAPNLETTLAGVHRADAERVRAAVAHLVASGEGTAEEFRLIHPDGQVRWVRSDASCVRDENGAVVAIHGTEQDITERKLAEQASQERERRLAEAEHVARLGSWEVDLSCGRVTWSDEMFRLWGFTPQSFEPDFETFLAQVHPDDRQSLLEGRERLRQGDEVSIEFRTAPRPEADQRWFSSLAQVICDDEGTPMRLCGTVHDISNDKRAQAERQAQDERYRRIVEKTYEGIWMTDAGGKTTFVNPRMAEILGYTVDEVMQRPVAAFVCESDQATLAARRERRSQGVSELYEVKLRQRDGTEVCALVSASPLLDDDGQYVGALAMVKDVTDWATP